VIIGVLLFVVLAFIVVAFVTWAAWIVLSTVLTGLVIGGLGRLLLPGRQPIGAIATILCGLGGALVGTLIGRGFGIDHLLTILIEIGAATVAVGVWSATVGRRPVASGSRGHRVIDI
jgi:uncharacterized membrane protein YeaQ/YmgE (transglycosylase-associated protein family)